MITAADYADWAHFAGLYVRNVSHADRYRAYADKLSPAGVVTRLVFDFLQDNPGGLDLDAWRSQAVYEIGDDARDRLGRTADALAAVGATRAAARVRTAEDKSPFAQLTQALLGGGTPDINSLMQSVDPVALMAQFRENVARILPDVARAQGFPEAQPRPVPVDPQVETREQIEHLLTEYVRAHQADLQADMERHGDPRRRPGFDPAERERELDQMRQREFDRENQLEQADKLGKALDKLEQTLAKAPDTQAAKLKNARRKILEGYRQYSAADPADLRPEIVAWLERARPVIDRHPDIFRPRPTDDPAILARLDDLGPYEVDFDDSDVTVTWDAPRGFEADWTEFSLTVTFPPKKKKALGRRLDQVDRLRRRWATHQADLRRQVLEAFEMQYDPEPAWMHDDYEKDADGRPTPASILQNAGGGRIRVGGDEGLVVYFPVEWDDEHGLELTIEDEPDLNPADVARAAAVSFHEAGPAVTEAEVAAFEARHGLSLPADYRTFLLRTNGGRPEPNHLAPKGQGDLVLDVLRLYSLHELGAAWEAHVAAGLPEHLLPIGLATGPNPFTGGDFEVPLLLGLSGPKSGKVLMTMGVPPELMAMAGAQGTATIAVMFDAQCSPLAPSLTHFLAQLTGRPTQAEPDWLQAIAAGDADGLLAWHRGGGKWTAKFSRYGDPREMTVTDYLALEGSPDLLQKLIAAGAVQSRALVESWSRWGSPFARLRVLLPFLDRNQRVRAFASPEIWAHPDVLEELRQSGVDLEGAVDDEGATPLHMATRAGSADGMRWLLAHGALPGTADKYGRTALVWAENDRQLECLKVLLEAGEQLESLFRHMPIVGNKLRLIRGRWGKEFPALAEYLASRGVDLSGV